ncbi:unnamed protein product, partial [Mesorhabditis belari]|uniref:Uncharacterized protein n=1 Tax=Mesorhabditis belari TaxID=2138241 RepID=A0AAF3FQQ4_9BILA
MNASDEPFTSRIFIGLCVSMQHVLGRQALSTFIQVNPLGWGLALGFCVSIYSPEAQIVGTACLTFFITVFTDKRNKIPGGIVASLVGLTLFLIDTALYYLGIPMVAPFIGGPLGGWLYHIFVGVHIPYDIDDEDRPETAAV